MRKYGSLDNYIQMHRQRVGLSQDELSFLIAVEQRGSISRYEQGLRFPNLETLIALEIVLDQPVRELFAGIYEKTGDSVESRARTLLESLTDDNPSKELVLKLELLSRLVHPDDHQIVPIWEAEE